MKIYCCGCQREVDARLTNGKELYPHRKDLYSIPIWRCDACQNFVGCHHKTRNRTKPLGCIPTNEIKEARKHIHKLLDPIWESGQMSRKGVYKALSDMLGYGYHTAEIRSIEEAREAYRNIQQIKKGINNV